MLTRGERKARKLFLKNSPERREREKCTDKDEAFASKKKKESTENDPKIQWSQVDCGRFPDRGLSIQWLRPHGGGWNIVNLGGQKGG